MKRGTYREAREASDRDGRTLGSAFLGLARRGPLKTSIVDSSGSLSRLKLAAVALSLGPSLKLDPDERRVGVLLPAGRAGALANLTLTLLGRTAVNLNHTLGPVLLRKMAEQASLETIITAHAYLDRIGPLEFAGRVLYAEDLLSNVSRPGVLLAMLKALVLPTRMLDRGHPADVAALVFSSGSVGEPKGVQLTHRQILANCDAIVDHLDLKAGQDSILTPLPLFHVFGLGPGLWLGLSMGFRVAAQADPRDGEALGRLAEATRPTFLISAPTFVRGYLRRIGAEQLASLRFAVVGAEACPHDLLDSFAAKYERPLFEGYGTTELSPVVSVNTPEAHRIGSVGLPLPGVEVFTIDPRTEERLAQGERGLLVVRSPARMLGYLDKPALTDKVFVHGGYNTGDIGWVDADGFVFLAGRMARFAKIGGEMVPMDNVEEILQQYLDADHRWNGLIAVVAVEDQAKGERLVVLHEQLPCSVDELHGAVTELPPLFRPRRSDYFEVSTIPILGSGKRDMVAIQRIARLQATGAARAADRPGRAEALD